MKIKEVKMSIGDRVVMVQNHELKRGTIKNIYTDLIRPILVVEFDNGEVEKVYPEDVAIEPKAEVKADQEVKEESTSKQKLEITITPEEFRKISVETAIEFADDDFILLTCLVAFSAKLSTVLFKDDSEYEKIKNLPWFTQFRIREVDNVKVI